VLITMKIKSAIPPALLLAGMLFFGPGLTGVGAAPLSQTTAVQTRPDPGAPVIAVLKAGSEPTPVAGPAADVPPGWMAVQVPGPFEGYVLNKDLSKNLEAKAGVEIRLAPSPEAGVLAVAAKGDNTEITGLHGRWTQVRLHKDLTGYIRVGAAAGPGSLAGPVAEAAPGSLVVLSPGPGKAAEDGSDVPEPRSIEGRFVSTRSLLSPRRPYDWQLDDPTGARSAYLDITKLLLTEQIDKYVDHEVVVYGSAKSVAGTNDIVVQVESLQLK
jgi:hypothetical protein